MNTSRFFIIIEDGIKFYEHKIGDKPSLKDDRFKNHIMLYVLSRVDPQTDPESLWDVDIKRAYRDLYG